MRMIDADSLESKLPAHSNDSNHVMTRNFAVEDVYKRQSSCRSSAPAIGRHDRLT